MICQNYFSGSGKYTKSSLLYSPYTPIDINLSLSWQFLDYIGWNGWKRSHATVPLMVPCRTARFKIFSFFQSLGLHLGAFFEQSRNGRRLFSIFMLNHSSFYKLLSLSIFSFPSTISFSLSLSPFYFPSIFFLFRAYFTFLNIFLFANSYDSATN